MMDTLIAQVSDPHLRPARFLCAGSIDFDALFAAALRRLATLDPQLDLVLLSGDVADQGRDDEHALARSLPTDLGPLLLAMPGSQDEHDAFRCFFGDHAHPPATEPLHVVRDDLGPGWVIGLRVLVSGEHQGCVGAGAARWPDALLAREPDRPRVVVMHQPPFLVDAPDADGPVCRDGRLLAEVVALRLDVERALCGHVHRFMAWRCGGSIACTAPSTGAAIALRFGPGAEPASVEPPSHLHRWMPDIGMVTHLVPVGPFPGPLTVA